MDNYDTYIRGVWFEQRLRESTDEEIFELLNTYIEDSNNKLYLDKISKELHYRINMNKPKVKEKK